MRITFDNQIHDFDDDLLKLSESLKWLSDGKDSEDEPIPLQKCDDEVFKIFTIWFNELKKIGFEIPKNVSCNKKDVFIFEHNMFMNYNLETLLKLLEFAFMNQIFLLFETMTFVFAELIRINKINVNEDCIKNKISKFYLNIINQKISHKDMNNNTIYTYEHTLIRPDETIELYKPIFNNDTKDLTATTVLIPYNTEIIGDETFAFCMDLKRIEIPDSVKFIGHRAFAECGKLKEIKIPESVKYMGEMVFSGCRNLEKIIIPKYLYSKDLFNEFTITNVIEHDYVYEITMYQTLYRYLHKFYEIDF